MSTAVENNVTNRSTKRNAAQLSLWGEPEPEIAHHHIQVVFLSGHREVYCTSNAYRPSRPGDWEWEAGFVGGAICAEECSICNPGRAA